MVQLAQLPNIGKTLANKLELLGISIPETLLELGSKEAFKKFFEQDPKSACINKLYALEGAIQGVCWHQLPPETKEDLKEYYDPFPKLC